MKVIEISKDLFAVTVDRKPSKVYLESYGTKSHAVAFLQVQKAVAHIQAAQKLLKEVGASKDSMTIGHLALDLVDTFDNHIGSTDWRA